MFNKFGIYLNFGRLINKIIKIGFFKGYIF